MPTVTVNGTQLAYVERGQGEPVLLVHGGATDYRCWAHQLDAFAASHRAIALSCRGSWPNAKLRPGETITLDTFVADLAGVIRALDAGPVHLVGHSSPGGFGGLRLAAQAPQLLRTVVLLEPPAFPVLGVGIPPRPTQLIKLVVRRPRAGIGLIKFAVQGVRPAITAFERGDDATGLRSFLAANGGKAAAASLPAAMFEQLLENTGPLKAQLAAGFPPFTPAEARSIRVPTLLVSGTCSPAHLGAVTARLAGLLPDVDRLIISGATHNMFASHPAQFNAGVLRFLRAHTAGGQ